MRRSTILVALVAAALILFGAVGSASAQTLSGRGDLESNPECICIDNVTDTSESCLRDATCALLTDCTTNGQADCAAGEICTDPVNGCASAVCVLPCA